MCLYANLHAMRSIYASLCKSSCHTPPLDKNAITNEFHFATQFIVC